MRKNPYDVLGVGRFADQKDIKSAYRRAAKKSHPDRNSPGREADRFCEIQEAYETLRDERRRKQCDRELARVETGVRGRGRRIRRCSPAPGAQGAPGRPVEPLDTGAGGDSLHLGLEIVLSPLEAKTGGRFPLRLPVVTACPECAGTFPFAVFCPVCRGSGRVRRELAVLLDLPAGIRDGSRTTVPFETGGAAQGVLSLLFRIDPGAG